MEAVQTAKGAAFWLTLGSAEVELKAGLLMPDAAAAQKVTADLQTEATKQVPALKLLINSVPGVPQSVKTMAQEMLGGLQFATDETLAVVTMKINAATLNSALAEMSTMAGAVGGPRPAAAPAGGPPQPKRETFGGGRP